MITQIRTSRNHSCETRRDETGLRDSSSHLASGAVTEYRREQLLRHSHFPNVPDCNAKLALTDKGQVPAWVQETHGHPCDTGSIFLRGIMQDLP